MPKEKSVEEVKTVEDLQLELQASLEAESNAKQLAADTQKQLDLANEKIQQLSEERDALKDEVASLVNTDAKVKTKVSKTGVGESFELDDKKYELLLPAVRIPGIGRMTALEILTSAEAQEKLVKMNSGAIKELA